MNYWEQRGIKFSRVVLLSLGNVMEKRKKEKKKIIEL